VSESTSGQTAQPWQAKSGVAWQHPEHPVGRPQAGDRLRTMNSSDITLSEGSSRGSALEERRL